MRAAKLNGKGKAATWARELCSRKNSLNPPVKLLCNWACNTYWIGFLLQPLQDPVAVSWVLFTSDESQCLQQAQPGWTLWHRWGYWPLSAGFLPGYLRPVTLCTVRGKNNKSLLCSVAMSFAKPQFRECMRASIKHPVVFLCLLLHPLWSFVLIHPQG